MAIDIADILLNREMPWALDLVSARSDFPLEVAFNDPLAPWNFSRLSARATLPLVLAQPLFRWDWYQLSQVIPAHEIFARPDLPWIYKMMERNLTLTLHDFLAHPQHNWRLRKAIRTIMISDTDVMRNPDLDWPWDIMHGNPYITPDLAVAYSMRAWNWNMISASKYLRLDHLRHHNRWNWYSATRNNAVPLDQKMATLLDGTLPWQVREMSYHPDIIPWVIAHPHLNWDYTDISMQVDISVVCENPQLPWVWGGPNIVYMNSISCNLSITMAFVIENLDKPLNWMQLSANPAISMQDVIAHPDLPWQSCELCGNPNINMQVLNGLVLSGMMWDYLAGNQGIHDWALNRVHQLRLKRLRARNREFKMPGWYTLSKLCSSLAFDRWYYSAEGVGRRVHRARQLLPIKR